MKRMPLAQTLAAALLIAVTALPLTAQTVEVAPATPVARQIAALVDGTTHDLRSFYAASAFEPAWSRNGVATPQARALVTLFAGAASSGLDPADYDTGLWASRMNALGGSAAVAAFDVALTRTTIGFVSDLGSGRVDPRDAAFAIDSRTPVHLPVALRSIATSPDVAATVAGLEPRHPEYQRLRGALAKYRRLAAAQDEAPLPVAPKVAPGDAYDALPRLAARLRVEGDLDEATVIDAATYSGALVDAVKRFQSRHGLDADGIIGRTTFAQLNTPMARRVEQIELALERWRWVPSQRDEPVILVNIPEFRLRARDANGEELTMRVVVGKAAGHRTPVFDGGIQHVVLRPYWGVPPGIMRNEIVPKVARDATYLARNGYELVDAGGRPAGTHVDADTLARLRNGSLRVRQKPGNANALGLLKILFPNDNHVYLHSTPQQALFNRTRRDFSHGCIRVEEPSTLAAWLLRDQPGWTKEKIEAAMKGDRDDVYIRVARPTSVVIFYATAVAQENGEVHFFDDIYGHDVQLAKMLEPEPRGNGVMVAAK